jgi:hypothetical protein
MVVKPPIVFCQECGNRLLLDDLKPPKRLQVKGDGSAMLIQPEDAKITEDDRLPPYVTIVWEEEIPPP